MTPPSHSTRVAPASGASRPPSLVGELADDMAARWRAGGAPVAEEYLARHPELWDQPDAALELIAEELALRHEYGRTTSPSELVRRFPRWRAEVETLWRCHRAVGSAPVAAGLPEPGTEVGDFRLVRELGRGAHGRVFLATQSALGGRAVVLKLAPKTGVEHLSLARLQHSHIVPLYSAHEFPERGLRGLCLPYFGQATLAALLARAAERPGGARTGADLLAALHALEIESPVPLPVGGPACETMRRASFVGAVCGIGTALADALEYAHSRGLLHLDVKPSNVLIAADGVPMLLDFHLARGPLAAGAAPPPWLGGTPEYMAPELAAAVEAVRRGLRIPQTVDGRADVFSLGRLLAEALGTGTGYRPDVSPGLRDLLASCTAPDPADRYPGAGQVAADLRRHLADLPLNGVPNRSLVERWRKWRRRRPQALPRLLLGTASALFLVEFGLHTNTRIARATTALRKGESDLQQGRFAESAETFRAAEALLGGVPFSGALDDKLRDGRAKAERARAAADLHSFCERVRPLYAAELVAAADARDASDRCRELWAQREQIVAHLDGQATAELDLRWRADLLDVGILTAHLHARLAPAAESESAHREALAVLDEAEALLGPSGVLFCERAVHARRIGLRAVAEEAERRAAALPPRTAWEHLIAGRALFAAGEFPRAGDAFDRCLELDPGSLWGNNYRGQALLKLRDFPGAAASFSACVALAPHTAWCFSNRGLAETECGRPERAAADFDRALELDPACAAALIGRATVRHRAGRFADALADLARARAAGVPPATVFYHTAAVHLAAGDRPAALAALHKCLDCDRTHPEALAALAGLESDPR
jgi:serine/threonine protein kinase/tetratricopeptide (TPR) repeat protein